MLWREADDISLTSIERVKLIELNSHHTINSFQTWKHLKELCLQLFSKYFWEDHSITEQSTQKYLEKSWKVVSIFNFLKNVVGSNP